MAEIFTPFLTAFILAYALRPVCLWLEGKKIPRTVAAAIAMIIGLGLVFLFLIRDVLLMLFVSLIIAAAADGPVDWLGAYPMLGVVILEVLHLFPIRYMTLTAALFICSCIW